MVELRSELVDKLRAGSTIEVTGVLRSTPLNKGSLVDTKYILAHSYSVVDEEALKTVVWEEQMEVEALCDSMDSERLDYLIWSWSGHLLCEPLLKRALFLQAVVPEESTFGHRSGIHILSLATQGLLRRTSCEPCATWFWVAEWFQQRPQVRLAWLPHVNRSKTFTQARSAGHSLPVH